MTEIENLTARLGFEFDDKKLKKFDKLLAGAVKGLTAIVAGAAAASTGIFFFTNKIASANDRLNGLAKTYGIAIETMQEFGFVAELNKGSAGSMDSALGNLSKTMSEASRGVGAGVETFGMLGLSVTTSTGRLKKVDDMMLEIADSIAKLGSQAQRLEFAQKLGFGPDLLLTLQQGSNAIKQQRQEARALGFVFSQDAATAAERFADGLLRVKMVFKGISTLIATRFMRFFVPIMDVFTKWYKINKDIIKQNIVVFLDKIFNVFKYLIIGVGRVIFLFTDLINVLGGLKSTLIVVSGILLAMNASALLVPVLMAALVAGLALVFEDLIVYAKGGDSAIGNLIKDIPILIKILDNLIATMKMVKEGWKGIFKNDTWENIKFYYKDMWKKIKRGETGLDYEDLSKETESNLNLPEKVYHYFRELGSIYTTPDKSDITDNSDSNVISKIIKSLPGINTSSNAYSYLRSGEKNITNNNSNKKTNNITVNVNGGDQDEIKRTINNILGEQYSIAETNLGLQIGNNIT